MESWQFCIIMFSFAELSVMWILYWHRKAKKVQQKVKVKNCCELERILYTHGETESTDTHVIMGSEF